MEVGPLARMLVGYAAGPPGSQGAVDMVLKKLDVPVAALFSTLGRTAARGMETYLVARLGEGVLRRPAGQHQERRHAHVQQREVGPATWPAEAQGVGMSEAPRGALAHWIVIKDQKIANYQLVVPSTWNASPRDSQGQRSAYEASLLGTPVADPEQAAGNPPHDPFVRSLPGLRGASLRPARPHPQPHHHRLGGRHAKSHIRSRLRLGDPGPVLPLAQRLQHRGAVRDRLPHRLAAGHPAAPPRRRTAYWFGNVRFLHFVAAYVFFFNFPFRIYWGFVGNRYASWKNFILYRKKQWKEIKQVIAVDILQARQQADRNHRPQRRGRVHLLHDVPGVPVPMRHRLWPVRRHEQGVVCPSCSPGSCR